MAYMLYKYLRRKNQERKSATADDSHLVPEVAAAGPQHGVHKQESVGGEGVNTTAPSQAQVALNEEEKTRLKDEASRRRIYRWKMILGLILPNFLAAVDVTIVAPAIPTISSHFNRLSGSFNWVVAAYTLTFTTFVPSSGQIAQIYGRHTALQFHMFFILIGSVFCAAAVTWGMLLFGRALQGAGAAGIMNLTRIILSDNVSLADNSKNNTIFSLIAGLSYAVGPVIGGYLANVSWRYCFVVPIPVAAVAMALIFFLMRPDLVKGRNSAQANTPRRTGYLEGLFTFDWPGIILFIFGIGLVILAIMWGGTEYAWSSAAVVAPLVVGAVLTLLFFAHEYLLGPGRLSARLFPRQVAMIPSTLYRKKDTTLLLIINFATGVSLVSAFYFISIYWQLAEGYSASRAGVQLLYYTPGLGVGVYSTLFLCNVWPRQTFYPLMLGSVLEAAGLALLTWSVSIRHKTLVSVFLAVAGAGTGMRFMPVVLHAAGTWPTRIPSMQSLLSFMVPLGETIGISMMGAVFTNKFSQGLSSLTSVPGLEYQGSNGHGPANLNILDGLPVLAREAVQNVAARAVMWSFVSILPFMGLAVVAAVFLGNVWIGRDASAGKDGEAGREEVKGKVLYGSYVKAVLSRSVEAGSVEVQRIGGRDEGEEKREKVADLEGGGV